MRHWVSYNLLLEGVCAAVAGAFAGNGNGQGDPWATSCVDAGQQGISHSGNQDVVSPGRCGAFIGIVRNAFGDTVWLHAHGGEKIDLYSMEMVGIGRGSVGDMVVCVADGVFNESGACRADDVLGVGASGMPGRKKTLGHSECECGFGAVGGSGCSTGCGVPDVVCGHVGYNHLGHAYVRALGTVALPVQCCSE